MRLAFADPRNLTLSPLNMHHGRPDPDISDLLPSVRQRGVLLSLLVRETVADGVVVADHYEVVAGRRRWKAALAAIADGAELDPLPVAILEAGDDAAAVEASLLENLSRLPPDEVSCWETFSRLVKSGRTVEQIAATFARSEVVVRRILALGGLLPRIRNLYRREEIDVATVRQLTLASKAQQKSWLALLDDPAQRAPTGPQLKTWLFGGASIPTKSAIFPLDGYPGQVVADLFGEDSYFADPAVFWTHQNAAIAARIESLRADGWPDVVLLAPGERFQTWTHEHVGRRGGGKVFVEVGSRGEVTFHEGWLSAAEARRSRSTADRGASDAAAPAQLRPEVTAAQQGYIDGHRHAAARVALCEHPGVALRLLVAHALAGAAHWRVEASTAEGGDQALAASLAASSATQAFSDRRKAAALALGLDPERRSLLGQRPEGGAAAVFARLLALEDQAVANLAAVVMGESLAVGGSEMEAAGTWLKVDLGRFWVPDTTFFDRIRDREVVNAMLREVGGRKVAEGNLTEKVRTQKAILRDHLSGEGGRRKVDGWLPRWMAFPATAYTRRPFAPGARGRAVAPLLRRAGGGRASDQAPAEV
jgi:ParB family chromosome partitioning protein